MRQTAAWRKFPSVLRDVEWRWFRLSFVVFLVGILIWTIPGWGQKGGYSQGNRFTDLGAAVAGGAIVAATVLFIERRYAEQAENRTLRFEVSRTKDVSGIDLRDKNFVDSYWQGKNVVDANLSKVILDKSHLGSCDFSGTLLYEASFVEAKLPEAVFIGSQLGGANFERADLRGASFLSANLSGNLIPPEDELQGIGANLAEADLENAVLDYANLLGVEGLDTAKNVKHARRNGFTIWPEGYSPPPYEPLNSH